MVLPSAAEAGAWFVEEARAALASGARLGEEAVGLLIRLAPADPIVAAAIEGVAPGHDAAPPAGGLQGGDLAGLARATRVALAAGDDRLAREAVTQLEVDVLRVYRPAHGLGRFEDDVAVALAMLDAYGAAGDEAHLMMAEELLLGALRRYWDGRRRHSLAVNCDAAVALAGLAIHAGKPAYRDRALEVLSDYAETYRALGVEAAPYVAALLTVGERA